MNRRYLQHYRETLKLGLPMVVGQVGVIVLGFADTVMVGHYDTASLAAASFVNNVFNLAIVALLGFSYGITPLIGALFARGEYEKAGREFRHALIANVSFGMALTLVMGTLYFFLDRFGQPEELLPLIRSYYLTILASVVFVAWFNAMRQFTDSLTRTSVGMWILLFGNVFNICFNYLLIFGKFGFPELGLLGAGISTLGARMAMVVVCSVYLWRRSVFAPYREGFLRARTAVADMRRIVGLSLPVSLQMGMETGTFSISAVMVGWLGTVALASYQVLMTIGTLGFMFYYSIGAAVAIRVSGFMGRGDASNVRSGAWAGYHLLLMLAAVVSLAFYLFSDSLISLFTDDEAVVVAASALILPLIAYQFGDATQVCFANALRGTARVSSMVWIAFFSYMAVGIPCSYLLGFVFCLGTKGLFYSFAVSLFMAAALFLRQFMHASRKCL